ncbi:MAG: hypothetical protein IPK53_17800 [bacterium]|nr:hypothetical protein [bacterium]
MKGRILSSTELALIGQTLSNFAIWLVDKVKVPLEFALDSSEIEVEDDSEEGRDENIEGIGEDEERLNDEDGESEDLGEPDSSPDDEEDVERWVYEVVEEMVESLRKLSGFDWTSVDYANIMEICRRRNIGRPIRIRGVIRSMSDVTPRYDCAGNLDTIDVELADDLGDELCTCDIADPELLDRVQSMFAGFHLFDFCGTILPAKPPKSTSLIPIYKFYLIDIAPSENPLQMVRATRNEIAEAAALVDELSGQSGAIMNHVRENLIEIIGIKGLEDAETLDRSLSFMVLQALSDGYDARRSLSHKLHSLIIGSPAVVKKLLTEAAHILNPVCKEAHPGKITVAGIAGKAVKRDGGWTSDPGYIPMAHRGTFVVQDFHHVERKTEIMGVFSMVMEDGRVVDSTAANKEHHALTSIHIDMNKQSDVSLADAEALASPQERLSDLGVSMNVLTRFDFIVNIPRDTGRQMGIALQMHSGTPKTTRFPNKRQLSSAARQLQVLIAYLRTKHDEVTIPANLVEDYIRSKQEELLEVNRGHLSHRNLLGDYQTRLANSIHKLIFAIARADARSVAVKEDVDEAFRYVKAKMDFLRTIEDFEVPETWNHAPVQTKVKDRQDFIIRRFGGQDVTVPQVLKAVQEELGQQVSESSTRRDLNTIAKKQRHGFYRVEQTSE